MDTIPSWTTLIDIQFWFYSVYIHPKVNDFVAWPHNEMLQRPEQTLECVNTGLCDKGLPATEERNCSMTWPCWRHLGLRCIAPGCSKWSSALKAAEYCFLMAMTHIYDLFHSSVASSQRLILVSCTILDAKCPPWHAPTQEVASSTLAQFNFTCKTRFLWPWWNSQKTG